MFIGYKLGRSFEYIDLITIQQLKTEEYEIIFDIILEKYTN